MPVMAIANEYNVDAKVKRDSTPKVSVDDVRCIRLLKSQGLSYRQIGQKFEISHEMVRRICINFCYREVV